jgi:predicted transcriptional regulator
MPSRIFKIDGKKLRSARLDAFLTQEDLARFLETKISNIGRIEGGNGGIYWNKIPKLAKAFEWTTDEVIQKLGIMPNDVTGGLEAVAPRETVKYFSPGENITLTPAQAEILNRAGKANGE